MQSRMSQRGINQEMINLAVQFGVQSQDKVVLSQKQLKALLTHIDDLRLKAVKALDKGGLVVVCSPDDGSFITTYGLDSFRRQAS